MKNESSLKAQRPLKSRYCRQCTSDSAAAKSQAERHKLVSLARGRLASEFNHQLKSSARHRASQHQQHSSDEDFKQWFLCIETRTSRHYSLLLAPIQQTDKKSSREAQWQPNNPRQRQEGKARDYNHREAAHKDSREAEEGDGDILVREVWRLRRLGGDGVG